MSNFTHIIIPTLGYSKMLQECVDSIEKFTTDKNYEVLIVNTKSILEDEEIKKNILGKYPNTKCKNVGYYHYAKNNNEVVIGNLFGVIPDDDYILFCNNDVMFKSDCIGLMKEVHEKNENVGTVGAMLFYENGLVQHAGVGIDTKTINCFHISYKQQLSKETIAKMVSQKYGKVFANTAALMLMKVDLFKKLNGFDEEYKICFEDLDLNLRATMKYDYVNYISYLAYAVHKESVSRGNKLNKLDTFKIRARMAEFLYHMIKGKE